MLFYSPSPPSLYHSHCIVFFSAAAVQDRVHPGALLLHGLLHVHDAGGAAHVLLRGLGGQEGRAVLQGAERVGGLGYGPHNRPHEYGLPD